MRSSCAALLLCVACALPLGCVHRDTVALAAQVGQRVTLVGVAERRKLGPAVKGRDFDVWIAGLDDWPEGFAGHEVRVSGIVELRHDLPVFVPKPGEPQVQGMPAEEGTNLDEASRRYVLRDATWALVR